MLNTGSRIGGLFLTLLLASPVGQSAADDPAGVEKRSPAQSKVTSGGAEFEMLLPDRAWVIPEKKPGAKTVLKLELRIKNISDKPLRFSRFDTTYPQLAEGGGKLLRSSGGRDVTLPAKESDFPLVEPGETTTFAIDAQLFWQDDKLRLGGSDGFGGIWGFSDGLAAGAYQFRIHYQNEREEGRVTLKKNEEGPIRRGFWLGTAVTPFVNVSIVPPGTRTVIKRAEDVGAVEKEGVRFEIVVKDSDWPIPENRPGNSSTTPLRLRITNGSDKPLRFSGFDTLSVELQDKDGKEAARWKGPYATLRSRPPAECDFPLVMPGKSVTFEIRTGLFWPTPDERTLFFRWWHASGSPGYFYEQLQPGPHKMRIVYENRRETFQVDSPEHKILENFWLGRMETAAVAVSLTEK